MTESSIPTLRVLMDKIILALPDDATELRQLIAMFMVKDELYPKPLDRKTVERALEVGADYKGRAEEYLTLLKHEHDDEGCGCIERGKGFCERGHRILDVQEDLERSQPPAWVFFDANTNATHCKRCDRKDPMPQLPMEVGAFVFLMSVTASSHWDCKEVKPDEVAQGTGTDERVGGPDEVQPAADKGVDSSEERTDGGTGTGSPGA